MNALWVAMGVAGACVLVASASTDAAELPADQLNAMPAALQQQLRDQAKEQVASGKAVTPGENQMKLGTNVEAAKRDLGVTFYTPQLSQFNDAMCAGGPCNNNVPGIAHRSWPLGACVVVCNLRSLKCAFSVVMDRGPAEWLRNRTIDANPALASLIQVNGLAPASYKMTSLAGPCNTGPVAGNANPVTGIDYTTPPGGATARPYTVGTAFPFATGSQYSSPPSLSGYGGSTSAAPTASTYAAAPQGSGGGGTANGTIASIATPSTATSYAQQVTQTTSSAGTVSTMDTSQGQQNIAPYAATIIVQPSVIQRGDTMTISWTSVGITSCAVLNGSAQLALARSGTKVVPTNASTQTGRTTYMLRCMSTSGEDVVKYAYVTVR